MICLQCPHERHPDRCWEVVERAGTKVLCPCSEFWGYTDLDGFDNEHDEGLPSGYGYREQWEEEKERHRQRTGA